MNLRRLLGLDILSEKYSYASDPTFARDPTTWVRSIGRRAFQSWRQGERERVSAASRLGLPMSVLDGAPPLLLELPVDGAGAIGAARSGRLPALFAEGRLAGLGAFGLGPITPANQGGIPSRVFEAGSAGRSATGR